MEVLSDVASERAVLAGIFRFSSDAYLDTADIIDENTFTINTNIVLYKCFKKIFKHDENSKIDLASIYATANELGLSYILEKPSEIQHIKSISVFPVELSNVRKFAAKIRKLQIGRLLCSQLEQSKDKVLGIDGHEPISEILGLVEDSIFNFTSLLHDGNEGTIKLSSLICEHVQDLIDNPVDQVGISTGFPAWDESVGGGLRRGTINVFGARAKVGKTLIVNNMAWNIAYQDIPILNFDTEMTHEDQINRSLAMKTHIHFKDIETGQFSKSIDHVERVKGAAKEMESKP